MRSDPKKTTFKTVEQFQKAATPLRQFLDGVTALNPRQHAVIVDQAITLLESFYAHLPLKSAMYAVDPVRRLRLLRHRLPQSGAKSSIEADLSFHAQDDGHLHVGPRHAHQILSAGPLSERGRISSISTLKPISTETSASLWQLISPSGAPPPKPLSSPGSRSCHGMAFRSHAPSRSPLVRAAVPIRPRDAPTA